MHRITPFLWFDGKAEEAMHFYVSVFPNSKVLSVSPMTVSFELDGQRFHGLNGGPQYRFTEAVSFFVDCETQDEVDTYWNKLTAGGGQPGQCGWLKDRFGLSWQIIPKALGRLLGDKDRARAGRVLQAMLAMGKIDIAGLERAYHQA
jgi:predicted 3-demethylubiquinone-9 3-methyltransferase (glyoxalase superfamily)